MDDYEKSIYEVTGDPLAGIPSVGDTILGRASWRSTRRQLLKGAFGGAVVMSLASLATLPTARRAYAGPGGSPGYQIKGSCPSYASSHNCNPGCGPSHVCGARSGGYCCVTATGSSKRGWHKNTHRKFKLRPNQCVPGTGWDGWKWKYSHPCGCCRGGLTYRCHDGRHCNKKGGNCVPMVCRWTTNCNPPYC